MRIKSDTEVVGNTKVVFMKHQILIAEARANL